MTPNTDPRSVFPAIVLLLCVLLYGVVCGALLIERWLF